MGRLNINHLILPISLWVASCSDIPRLFDEKKKNTRASESSSFVPTQIVNGVVTASIAADSTGVQRIQVEKTSLGGAAVEFPPGALAVTTDINIEEATSLATPGQASELGISQEFGQKGPAVLVSPSEPQDAVTPFTIAIPISSPTGLVQNDDNLAVLYRVKSEATQTMSSGIIPRSQLTVVDRNVSFPTSRFGSYQAVYLAAPVESAVEVPTTLPPQSHAVAASLPPLQVASCTPFFVKAGDTVTISGSNIRSSLTLAWNSTKIEVTVESDGSASFVAPSEGKAGLSTIVIEQDGISTTASMFYSGSDAYPMMSVGATEVCEGVKYFDQHGTLQTGSKTCQANSVCTADGQVGCITSATFKAADMNQVASGNIKTGITIAGVSGSIIPESHNTCSSDGAIGCVTTASYKSADMAVAIAGNIKFGNSIAGVAGSYSGTNNSCVSDGEASCVVDGSTFKAAKLSNFNGGDIKSGVSIAGVTGSATLESHADCAADGLTGCVTTASYKSADMSVVNGGGNIKSGITIAGVTGQYPSATYPLTGADATADLDFATFNAKIKSASPFEWFDAYGNRFTSMGDSDIVAANIISGMTIFGTTGTAVSTICSSDGEIDCITTTTFKSANTSAYNAWDVRKGKTIGGVAGEITFYKNMANTALYDRTTGDGAVAGLDVYDTIDDYNNGGIFPTQNNIGWDQAAGTNWVMDPANDNGMTGGTASNGICDGGEACVFKDRLTNMMWAKNDATTRTWETAITYCENLIYGGYFDWRLPTQKDLMQAYTNGIWSQKASAALNLSSSVYWSSSTLSFDSSNAWVVHPDYGYTGYNPKSGSYLAVCVR